MDLFVRSAMLQAMVGVMAADGDLGDHEIDVILEAWGPGLTADEVRAEVTHRGQGRQLSDFAARLSDDDRRAVLDAAVRVARADGRLERAELTELQAVAEALGLELRT